MRARNPLFNYRRLTQLEVDAICTQHDRLWHAKPGGARTCSPSPTCPACPCAAATSATPISPGRSPPIATSPVAPGSTTPTCSAPTCRRPSSTRPCAGSICGTPACGAPIWRAPTCSEADLREGSITTAERQAGPAPIRACPTPRRIFRREPARSQSAALEAVRGHGCLRRLHRCGDAGSQAGPGQSEELLAERGRPGRRGPVGRRSRRCGSARRSAEVEAKTVAWNVNEADLKGALTDKPLGRDVADLPYSDMLSAHALWCETGGLEGGAVGLRRGRSEGPEIDPRHGSDRALSSPGRGVLRPGHGGRAVAGRAPRGRGSACPAICAAPIARSATESTPSCREPTCARPTLARC